MSYLLMQIFVCLLIAGLIGMVIGWLLRGDHKKVLEERDQQWKHKINQLEQRWVQAKESEVQSVQLKAERINNELEEIKNDLQDAKATHQSQMNKWQLQLDNAHQQYHQERALTQQQLVSLEQTLHQANTTIQELHAENDALKAELTNTQQALHSATEDKNSTHPSERDIIRRLSEWKKRYKATKKELDECQNTKSKERDQGSDLTAQHLLSKSVSTNNKEEETAQPVLLREAKDGKKDNLTLIKGIGKVLEARLNHLGVFHFEQIASWSKSEQTWIDKYMSFPGRVEREAWVQQAQKLLNGIETEFAKRVKRGDVPSSKQE